MGSAETVLVDDSAYVATPGTTGNDVVYRFHGGGNRLLVGWNERQDDDHPVLVVHPQGSVLAAAAKVDRFTIEPFATDDRGAYFTEDAHPQLAGTYL